MLKRIGLALAAAGLVLVAEGALAADLYGGGGSYGGGSYDSGYGSGGGFTGPYVGATAGFGQLPTAGRAGTLGGVVGTNVPLGDTVVAGAEAQADFVWNDVSFAGVDAVALGKVGANLGGSTLIYGAAGAGVVDDEVSYVVGAGVEQAMTSQFSVRGEVQGSGQFGGTMDGGKAKVGVLWHLQ